MADDDLEKLWADRVTDLPGQQLIEAEWQRRDDAVAEQRATERNNEFEHVMLRSAVTSQLGSVVPPTDSRLLSMWHEAAELPDLQDQVGAAIAERGLAVPTPPDTQVDAEPDLVGSGEFDPKYDRYLGELDRAWETMSVADYIAYEATLISDPAQRTPVDVVKSKPSLASTNRRIQQEYSEYCFERYVEAETACRAHLLNARGRALKVDPFSLMSGNPKRMHAYASDEFKGFIGKTGGHMSYARFKSVRTTGQDRDEHLVEGFRDAVFV